MPPPRGRAWAHFRSTLVAVALAFHALPAEAQAPLDAPICVEPARVDFGPPDLELDRALRAAAPLLVPPARAWRFGSTAEECTGTARIRLLGHRSPDVHYSVHVELPEQPTRSIIVESELPMGTFAVAEAICVNALLLLGQPGRVVPPSDRPLHLWIAPSATLGLHTATLGSELGVTWQPSAALWLAASLGLEGFGSGSSTTGKYQYSVLQAAIVGGWRWEIRRLVLAAGLGLRQRTWWSHLQTAALHEHYDVGVALAGELRASVRVTRPLRVGLSARPSLGLEDMIVAAPGEPELFRVPRFLVQVALEFAIDL